MVAGDHDRPDPGGGGLGDRRPRLGARRVDDPDEAEVDELALDLLVAGRGERRRGAAGTRRRACATPAGRAGRPSRGSPPGGQSVSGRTSPADALGSAAAEQDVRRALRHDRDAAPLGVGLERAHELPLGAERHLADALEARASRLGKPFDLGLRDQERCLGRVALDRPLAVLLAEHGVVRQAAAQEHGAHLVEQDRVVERTPADAQLALGHGSRLPSPPPRPRASPPTRSSSRSSSASRSCPSRSRTPTPGSPPTTAASRSPACAPCAARRARGRRRGRPAAPPARPRPPARLRRAAPRRDRRRRRRRRWRGWRRPRPRR